MVTSTPRRPVRFLCVKRTNAGRPVPTRFNTRSSTRNSRVHSSPSRKMRTCCIRAGAKSWAYTSKPDVAKQQYAPPHAGGVFFQNQKPFASYGLFPPDRSEEHTSELQS